MSARLAMVLFAALAACQSADARRPAVLARADAETMAALEAALADAMGVARVEIGAADLTRSPVIPVLPAPPSPAEGRSPAAPTLFDLALVGDACVAVRRSSGAAVALPGVRCAPASGGP
ncbi:MAG: hypothetical protein GC206_05390 [Alphaproteobacteria bacterium]|nr:hypothetical protein [Alphaproteobacteria bacterium]